MSRGEVLAPVVTFPNGAKQVAPLPISTSSVVLAPVVAIAATVTVAPEPISS